MRYYFDVELPNGKVRDREGTEHFHRDDMQTSAVKLLLEIARDEPVQDPYQLSVHVRDASGRTISTVTLNMAMIWSGVH